MTFMDLLIALHKDNERQGPGSVETTRMALVLSGLKSSAGLKIADIGCGTGTVSLQLAKELGGHVTAVDFLPAFLQKLEEEIATEGLQDQVSPLNASMDALPFAPESLDVIWSEGAIYNMGFEAGIKAWKEFLKPSGILAVSEITWLTNHRPAELDAFWNEAYPQINTASAKIAQLEEAGYTVLGYFPLPQSDWLAHYYDPLEEAHKQLIKDYGDVAETQNVIDGDRAEIALYKAHKAHVSYGFYIARKN